jgi:hypothetical protein
MGDGYDDDMSPALLEKRHRLLEERRKRELDQNAQRQKEQEYPDIYGGPCTGSHEFNAMAYALIKLVIYIAFLAVVVRSITNNYDLRPCNAFGDQCLFSNVTTTCVSTEASAQCRTLCIAAFPDAVAFANSGCEVSNADPTNINCVGNFQTVCIATDTCPARPNDQLKTALRYAAAVFGILAGLELFYAWAMAATKSLHFSDFDRLSTLQKGLVIYSKIWGLLSQIVWFLGILSAIHLFYIWDKYESWCSSALTTNNEKYAFFRESFILAVAVLLIHIVLVIVGTYFRARVPLRGNIYRASDDNSIHVPLGLDCHSCRTRARPRWCSGLFRPHVNKENCVGCCCNCTSCLIDSVCCVSFECVGLAIDKVWRHRHFIGP